MKEQDIRPKDLLERYLELSEKDADDQLCSHAWLIEKNPKNDKNNE